MSNRAAEMELEQARIAAPWPGIVQARLLQEGEWVMRGQGAVRLVRMDRLRVGGLVQLVDIPS